jgi:hypothetical protein
MEDQEEAGNLGKGHESADMKTNKGTMKALKLGQMTGMVKTIRLLKSNKY